MSASTRAGAARARRWAGELGRRFPVVVDVARTVRRPRRELEVALDLRRTRRAGAFLRRMPAPTGERPVLVSLYREDVYDAKVGTLLGMALRRFAGHPVLVVVPSRRMTRARRLAAALGADDVVALDEVPLTDAEACKVDELAARFDGRSPTFDEVREWRFADQPLGTHLLSTVIRLTFEGDPDLDDPRTAAVARGLASELGERYLRWARVLDERDPALVLVEESHYSVNGPLVDLATARGIDVIRTVPIWREDALISKRLTAATRRTEPKSIEAATLAELDRTPWTQAMDAELDADFARRYGGDWELARQFQPGTADYGAEELVAALGIDPARPSAVVFCHVLWDASLFFGVDLFRNYGDWLARTVEAAIANPALNWVVKAHPANVFRARHGDVSGESRELVLLRDRFGDLPPHVRVLRPETPVSTLSLYRFADYGITVRGTPGLEMACFGKPVLTAGTGHYSGLGFTVDSTSPGEYLERLATITRLAPVDPAVTGRARRYAHALFLGRPWVTRSFHTTLDFRPSGWHPLDRNVALDTDGPGAFDEAGDLRRWAAWVTGGGVDGAELEGGGVDDLSWDLSPATGAT
jgi:hypothetical protein